MTGQIDAAPHRLLLVDDDPLIAGTLADGLRRAGFEVTVATVASDAIEFARQRKFSLAIVDFEMPGQNGLETAALFGQLRQPFVFLSAYSEDSLVSAAISAGALSYVVKPIDPIHLIPTIRAAIQRARELSALVEQTEKLTRLIDSNRDVSVAVGLLMAQRGLPRHAAYETLRQYARRTRRKLADLAVEIAAGAEALSKVPSLDAIERGTAKTSLPGEEKAS